MSQNQSASTQLMHWAWLRLCNVVWGLNDTDPHKEPDPPLYKATDSLHYQRPELCRELELLEGWTKEIDESPVQNLNEVTNDGGNLAPFLQRNVPDHPLNVYYEELARHRQQVASETVPDTDWPDRKTQVWWESNKGWFMRSHVWSEVSNPRAWFDGMGIPKRIAYNVIPADVV